MKETFWISTQLSSTKLTQNGTQLICSRRLSRSWIMCLNMHDYTWEFQTVTQKKVFLIPLSPSVCIYGLVWLLAFLSDIVVVTWHKAAWGDSIKVRKNCHHLLWFWHTDTCFQPLCCANSGFLIYDSFYSVVHIKRLFCGSQAEVWIWAFFRCFPGVWHSCCLPVDLLALLKWKAHPDRVMDILGRLRHVSGEEIVKVRFEVEQVGRLFCLICVNTCIVDHHNIL